ncbi:hypothetical protein [Thiothrix subterranea]|uniref:Uncharacterized protein n=4 Tax=Thiothrix subterranea TaxID=2735563 RepID=A0AA51R4Z3_9GAMM|nr:hypothetical protein [Thiothrix subterranea]WML87156.1 hypothetical protein RCG00_02085 [Thiothrix subterranea]
MKIHDLLKTKAGDGDLIFNDKHRAIKNHQLMQWAKWATFGLYIVAVFMLYVADVWGIGTFIEQKSNDWVALIVFSVIAFTLAFFLASSKEAVYEDIAIHRSEGYKLKTSQIIAMGLFLTSGLLFEAFSTSNNQQHIANSAAENSGMMKEVTGSNVTLSTGSAALTQDLQAAQMRLADCKVRMEKALAKGKTFDCAQSEANVAAVRESMQMANAMANDTNAAALNAKTDAMLKVREHFDKPMFQAIGKATQTDNNTGMLLVIGVLIFVFECQHIMALFAYANALRRIKGKVGNVAQDQPRSTQDAYNLSPTLSAPMAAFRNGANSAKQTVGEYAAKIEEGLKASPEIIATEYARAQHGRNQQMEAMGNAAKALGDKIESAIKKPEVAERHHLYCTLANGRQMDKVFKAHEADAALKEWQRLNETGIGEDGNPIARLGLHQTYFETEKDAEAFEKKIEAENLKWQSDAPVIKSVTGFKQSPDQAANVNKLYQTEMAKHEAGEVFNESPTPPIQRMSVSDTIKALVDTVKKSGATTEADIQAAVFDGYAKLFNPADFDDKDLLKVAGKIAKSTAPATLSPVMPFQQRTGATGLHNPALGTAEAIYPLPLQAVHVQSLQPRTDAHSEHDNVQVSTVHVQSEQPELTAAAKEIEADLYPQWLELVQRNELTAGARDCKRFISQSTFTTGDKTVLSIQEMQRIWSSWQDRAANDGVLVANPKYQPGNRQAKYLLA